MKKIVLTILAVLLIEGLCWTVFIFSGAYNVSSASGEEDDWIDWWLSHATKRSIEHHARDISVPELNNPAMVQEGFHHFDEMCVQCHGAPGKPPGEIAKGLSPDAPDLAKAVPDWNSEQLFWITKNGIKFTAMPGWGASHQDEAIWEIVAFLKALPNLAPADYQRMAANAATGHAPEEGRDDHEN